jgi:hypothetical protein
MRETGERKMPIDVHPKRKGPTSDEVVAEQKRSAEVLKEQKRQHNAVPAKVEASTPAPLTIDNRTPEEIYSDTIAPTSFAGERIRFSKDAQFLVGTPTRKLARTLVLSHCLTRR